MEDNLPPVAHSVFLDCKKCEADRYHKVITHVDKKSAKVQCEVCGAKKTFKIGKPSSRSKKKTTTRMTAQVQNRWGELKEKLSENSPQNYTIKGNFEIDDVLEHPSFGLGFVVRSSQDRINVVFENEEKILIHNKK